MRMLKFLISANVVLQTTSQSSYDLGFSSGSRNLSSNVASTVAKVKTSPQKPGFGPKMTGCITSRVTSMIASDSFAAAAGSDSGGLDVSTQCASAGFTSTASLSTEPTGSESGRGNGESESVDSQTDTDANVQAPVSQSFDLDQTIEGAIICGSLSANPEISAVSSITTLVGNVSIPTACPSGFESGNPSTAGIQFTDDWGSHQFDGVYCNKKTRYTLISGTTISHSVNSTGPKISVSLLSIANEGDILLSLKSNGGIIMNGTFPGTLNQFSSNGHGNGGGSSHSNGHGNSNGNGNNATNSVSAAPTNPVVNSTADLIVTITRPASRRGGVKASLSVSDATTGQALLSDFSGRLYILNSDASLAIAWIEFSNRVPRVSMTFLSVPESVPPQPTGRADQSRFTYVFKAGSGSLADSVLGYVKVQRMVPLSNLKKFELLFALGRIRSQRSTTAQTVISGTLFGSLSSDAVGTSDVKSLYASSIKSAIKECRSNLTNSFNFTSTDVPQATGQLPYSCSNDDEGNITCTATVPSRRLLAESTLPVCTIGEANTLAATSAFSLIVSSCLATDKVTTTAQFTTCMVNTMAGVGIDSFTRGCFECLLSFILTQVNLLNTASNLRETCIQSPTDSSCLNNLDFTVLLACSGGYDPRQPVIQPYCSETEASNAVTWSVFRTAISTCLNSGTTESLLECLGYVMDQSNLSSISTNCFSCWSDLMTAIANSSQKNDCVSDPTGTACTSAIADDLVGFHQCSGFSAVATDYESLVRTARDSGSTSDTNGSALTTVINAVLVGLLITQLLTL